MVLILVSRYHLCWLVLMDAAAAVLALGEGIDYEVHDDCENLLAKEQDPGACRLQFEHRVDKVVVAAASLRKND